MEGFVNAINLADRGKKYSGKKVCFAPPFFPLIITMANRRFNNAVKFFLPQMFPGAGSGNRNCLPNFDSAAGSAPGSNTDSGFCRVRHFHDCGTSGHTLR